MAARKANGWKEKEALVLSALERLETKTERLDAKVDKIHVTFASAIASLNVKASVWGVVGGLLAALIALAMKLL